MKSIRIADDLYSAVQQEGALMTRSIAQQLEHWARLGAALEAAGVTADQLRSILGGAMRCCSRT
jgi:ParD-like antitoxin of type II bacterial toxin-antitoxin system